MTWKVKTLTPDEVREIRRLRREDDMSTEEIVKATHTRRDTVLQVLQHEGCYAGQLPWKFPPMVPR
jgi:DNA invertase Pin-like site-specific DNA recombinase